MKFDYVYSAYNGSQKGTLCASSISEAYLKLAIDGVNVISLWKSRTKVKKISMAKKYGGSKQFKKGLKK